MTRSADQNTGKTVIHRHSGWLIPLGFALALLALSGLFLLWYLRPGPRDVAPTGDAAPVALSVQGVPLLVPANYIETAAARRGGEQASLVLFALIPDMRGYSQTDARLFAGNAPDSAVVHLLLRADPNALDAAQRLERIYRPHVVDPEGVAAPFGLTQYSFRTDSDYAAEDLFSGGTGGETVLLLCERAEPDLPSPNCLAAGPAPAKNLGFSYRFKRAYLSDWQDIAAGVNRLMMRFQKIQRSP